MKPLRSVLSSALLVLALGSAVGFAGDAAPPPTAAGERMPPETIETKVLKAFVAKDGEAIFRAYLVKWKDQEIVVSDALAKSNYKEGDTIKVLVINLPFPRGAAPYRLLSFVVLTEQR